MAALEILLLVIVQVTLARGECRDSWTKFDGACYLFAVQPATWAEAQAMCGSMNSHLTEIQSEIESKFLESKMREIHGHETSASQKAAASYWIGGNDLETEGIFKWVSSDSLIGYSDWTPGQPDDAGKREDCMELRGTFNYHWNDLPCTTRQHFICETPLYPDNGQTIIG